MFKGISEHWCQVIGPEIKYKVSQSNDMTHLKKEDEWGVTVLTQGKML